MRSAFLSLALVASGLLAWPHSGLAEAPLIVGSRLDGVHLGPHLTLLEDPSAQLSIEDVAGDLSTAFVDPDGDVPSFGFSDSAIWLRFTAENRATMPTTWLLELAYPHLDAIELYEPGNAGGFVRRVSGDRIPFHNRDLAYRNVVFRIEQPPGLRTYYLRGHTSGSLTLPLVAWTSDAFLHHLNLQQPALWMFYGLLLAISLYNLFIFFSVRERAYFYYVAYTVAYAGFQFVLNGLAFQYLWPDWTWWANQCMPVAISLAFFFGAQFHRSFLHVKEHFPVADRIMAVGTYGCLAAACLALVAPYEFSIRMVVAFGTGIILVAVVSTTRLVLRRYRPAYFYATAWALFLVGILLYLLKTMNVLPSTFATEWAIQIGASLEVILLSLGLADRINVMRQGLQGLNEKLSENVAELRAALSRAEEARRAKSEFLAGVSHELRTPLNSIINIPEGLLEEFVPFDSLRCGGCRTAFELEPGEVVDVAMACPECGAVGALQRGSDFRYRGKPERTVHYLSQVVRSGSHLLDVINDILDVSRLEAGRMSISMEQVDMPQLIERVLGPMAGLAERSQVALEVIPPPGPCRVRGDAVKLGQILINLVGNAIKFSDGRGTVRVHAVRHGDDLVISVADQGVGIDPVDQTRIFESFVQAKGGGKRKFGGSGLGLAITKQLVELHGGAIWLESELGEGSTFYVRLPCSRPEGMASGGPPRTSTVDGRAAEGVSR